MNISYNWLKQYVDFDLSPADLAAALTSIGLETGSVEEVESVPGGLKGLTIGHVETCVAHPDSDHLHITTVDLGPELTPDGPVQIVCGAPNVAAGQTVVVAPVGTVLHDPEGNEFKIKRSKIRGVESLGMICAEDEIGIGTSHDGIIVIDKPVRPGTPAAEHFGLTSDWVLEVDLTPNRIDAASHFGVARDLAAWLAFHAKASELRLPQVDAFKIDNPDGEAVSVEVADREGCLRYCGVTVRGVKVAESPKWLRERLMAIGQRPINNIVDITNYILLGLGQPLHCFDLAKVGGHKVIVDTCAAGTEFVTLDEVERKLDGSDLMICDGSHRPMCIAGVFGGLDSGVTDTTTDVFIESACFHPTRVRRTARRHGLSTDASFRFERGVDPNLALYAVKLAALLVKQLAGGEITGRIEDVYPQPAEPYAVEFDYGRARRLIGKEIADDEFDRLLGLLEIGIDEGSRRDGKVTLRVPTYRYDVRRECDVVEECLRIYGYNNVAWSDSLHTCLTTPTLTDLDCRLTTLVSEQLTAEGFNEILNNSLTARSYYEDNPEFPLERCIALLNPLSQDLGVMRQTLLYGGLESLAHNINRREGNLRFYEFGNVYTRQPGTESTMESPLAPYAEQSMLGLWLSGALRPGNWARAEQQATVFDMKAVVANILARLGLDTRRAEGLVEIVQVDKATLRRFGIKQPVVYASLRWGELVKRAAKVKIGSTPLAKTQAVKRDLALLIDRTVSYADVEKAVRKAGGKLLSTVDLFDVYEGDKLPEGKKSYAITMTLQDPEKTLNDKQIDGVMAKIVDSLKSNLKAELR